MSRPPSPDVPGGRVSPHVPVGRVTRNLLWAAALQAAQPCGVSLTAGGSAPASLWCHRLTPVASVAGPLCLAGDPLMDGVPARLSPVVAMAPGDVYYVPRCSLAGVGPAALGYRPCCWPGGSAGSPQGARPMGCGLLIPVPRSTYVRTLLRCAGPLASCSPVWSLGVLWAVSWATWLLFTAVPARCVLLCVRCPGPLGSCSPVCLLGALCCVCGDLGHLAPVHRCACLVYCVGCAVSWATWLLFSGVLAPVRCFACAVTSATWLLFTGAHPRCVVLCVRCPRQLGSCLLVCQLGALSCLCSVLGHLAPVHDVLAPCVVFAVRCPGQLNSCSPVWPLGSMSPVWGVLGDFGPVHQWVCSACCVACAVSWAT